MEESKRGKGATKTLNELIQRQSSLKIIYLTILGLKMCQCTCACRKNKIAKKDDIRN